jgi:hypothetical protein
VTWVFSIDTAFNCMAMDLDLFLEHTDWFTSGNPQLFGDEINTRNHFGDIKN